MLVHSCKECYTPWRVETECSFPSCLWHSLCDADTVTFPAIGHYRRLTGSKLLGRIACPWSIDADMVRSVCVCLSVVSTVSCSETAHMGAQGFKEPYVWVWLVYPHGKEALLGALPRLAHSWYSQLYSLCRQSDAPSVYQYCSRFMLVCLVVLEDLSFTSVASFLFFFVY